MAQCRECRGPMPPRINKRLCGNQPEFCSRDCKKSHLRRYHLAWSANNRDRIEASRAGKTEAYNKSFYARNRERRKRLANEWYHSNTEFALASQRRWADANPDLVRAIGRRSAATRRARLFDAFVEQIDPAMVFQRSAGVCGICKLVIDPGAVWHVDHIVPLTKGGKHAYDNVQASHGRCNIRKGNKLICHESPST